MEPPIQRSLADDGTATVAVRGDVDFTNADDVAEGIQATLADLTPTALRVDLRGATFIDSTGLGALIAGYRAAAEAGVPFTVANPSVAFRRILTVTGLCELFGLAEPEHASDGRRPSDVAI